MSFGFKLQAWCILQVISVRVDALKRIAKGQQKANVQCVSVRFERLVDPAVLTKDDVRALVDDVLVEADLDPAKWPLWWIYSFQNEQEREQHYDRLKREPTKAPGKLQCGVVTNVDDS